MTSMGKSDTASEKLNYFIFKYIWRVRSRQTLKHHFFILSQAQPHSGLPYPVHALQGQQLLHERSACSSPRPPSAAGNTSFVMVECLWHATVSHSFCSLFLPLCCVSALSHTGFPWAATAASVELNPAHQSHLGTPWDSPRHPQTGGYSTKLLEFSKEKSSKQTRNPQTKCCVINHTFKRGAVCKWKGLTYFTSSKSDYWL